MSVKMSNPVSEPRSAPPRPITPDPTISAEKARALTEISIREKVFELIREATKAGKYITFVPYDLPFSLKEELKELDYKIKFMTTLNEYKIDWSKDE